jgi:DNA-binding transcriptional MerR regulator/methylmalonyl-CoA mutase cobalamin-binding subunit
MDDARYRIGTAARLAGLTTHAIRVWERRYGALTPDRSAGGARLYTEAEIERLRRLKRAVDRGHSIGQIARLPDAALSRLGGPTEPPLTALRPENVQSFAEDFVDAVRSFDLAGAERVLSRGRAVLAPRMFVMQLLGPALQRVGDAWAKGDLCVASEHVASVLVRDQAGALLREYGAEPDAETLVATTPAGELHEIGALLVAVTAAMRGFRVAYLGPNLPASEISEAVNRTGATIVALSVVALEARAAVREIRALEKQLTRRVRLLVGGMQSAEIEKYVKGGLDSPRTLAEFEQWLADRRARKR